MLSYDHTDHHYVYEQEAYVLDKTIMLFPMALEEEEGDWCITLMIDLPEDKMRLENVKIWFSKKDKLVDDLLVPYYSVYTDNGIVNKKTLEKAVRFLLTLNYDIILKIEEKIKKDAHEETKDLFILQQ